jgi:hypothetical protein
MTSQFGSAEVHLKHPERELLHSPQVLSYAQLPYGTYPDWFDTTYWNDQIKPHFRLRDDLPRAHATASWSSATCSTTPKRCSCSRCCSPVLGARAHAHVEPPRPATNAFWLAPLLLGVLIWGIYATVNTEERYVTVAYLTIILTLFATLRVCRTPRTSDLEPRTSALHRLRPHPSARAPRRGRIPPHRL